MFNKNKLDANINNVMANESKKEKKTFFKSWKGKALIVFIILGFIGSLGNNETDTPTDETQDQAKTEQTTDQQEATEAATETVAEEPKEPELTPEQIAEQLHTEWVNAQFSAWDGSHIALKDLVKENMNDPKSFEHVETKLLVLSTQEHIDTLGQGEIGDVYVYMKFRGKNAFGGLVLNEVEALSSYADNYIKIISQN